MGLNLATKEIETLQIKKNWDENEMKFAKVAEYYKKDGVIPYYEIRYAKEKFKLKEDVLNEIIEEYGLIVEQVKDSKYVSEMSQEEKELFEQWGAVNPTIDNSQAYIEDEELYKNLVSHFRKEFDYRYSKSLGCWIDVYRNL